MRCLTRGSTGPAFGRPVTRNVLSRRVLPAGMEMKAYLDNNVVSSIARDDTASESDALDALMAAYDAGKVDLGGSIRGQIFTFDLHTFW
jgi:hypothetical protein